MKTTALVILAIMIHSSFWTLAGMPCPTPPIPAFTLADLKAQFPQDEDGAFLMELSDILNTAADPAVRGLLDGQPVVTTAQICAGQEDVKGSLTLVRSQMQCCASHLRQCKVTAEWPDKTPGLKLQTWVRVSGTLSYRQKGAEFTPCIRVKQLKEIPAPADLLIR